MLKRLADAYVVKYGAVWRCEVGDGTFRHGDGGAAHVFRLEPSTVLAFAKASHGQSSFRFLEAMGMQLIDPDDLFEERELQPDRRSRPGVQGHLRRRAGG